MTNYVCIHGHFYQPSRENPWLEEVELQDSANPYHDWNEKITAECYAPNTASRILDSNNRIIAIVNNYTKISFNFGPTLLSWLERHEPEVYESIIEADKESRKYFSGHGPAIAQVYNHVIMPLANRQDKITQVIWGIRDFENRFGRRPEGMWLPETAVDVETLDVMAEQGIKFTILAPHQARCVRKIGEESWINVSGGNVNTRMPYLCRLPSGRTISIFFYNGAISNEVAFGGLLKNGVNFAKRLISSFSPAQEQPQIVNIATDGETYGHHFRFGDMALAYCIYFIESNNLAKITVYGEYLEKNPPTYEVKINENTSWSCFHGVERWRNDCGCNIWAYPGWTQKWRAVLREAMDWLRDNLALIFEREISAYVQDSWQARNDYVRVILDRSVQNVERFFSDHAVKKLSKEEKTKILKLLEMQRHAMLMYSSDGWFFDEISGIEAIQIMQHAARAIQLAREVSGIDLEPDYLKILERAQSNISEYKNGANLYSRFVKPNVIDLLRVGAHYAVSSLFKEYPETIKIYCYTANSKTYEREKVENRKLAIGRAVIRSDITWEESIVSFAVVHLGHHNIFGGVYDQMKDYTFSKMSKNVKKAFQKGNIAELILSIDAYFETHSYSLWHLFKDEQRKILKEILEPTQREVEDIFRKIYKDNYPLMQTLRAIGIHPPTALSTVIEFILNTDIRRLLESEKTDLEQLKRLVEEMKEWSVEPDKTILEFAAKQKINKLMEKLAENPEDLSLLETIDNILKILSMLPLELDLWKAQNIYFSIIKKLCIVRPKAAESMDFKAKKLIEHFNSLEEFLKVKCM
ncbi:MAG: DUF3536 domain-containing protein [Candidatus Jordarchaeaceae archaeon]